MGRSQKRQEQNDCNFKHECGFHLVLREKVATANKMAKKAFAGKQNLLLIRDFPFDSVFMVQIEFFWSFPRLSSHSLAFQAIFQRSSRVFQQLYFGVTSRHECHAEM